MMERTEALMVRRATAADLVAISELVPQLVASGPPEWRDAEQMTQTDQAVIQKAVLDEGADARVWVGVLSGEVLAFLHARVAIDYYTQNAQGHVADIVVADRARGLGVGTRLLEEAERWARAQGFRQLTIAVFERNTRALELYERRGFHREIIRLIKPLR
jgi:ribosomal protein S18 acetylase RimI-like enzyme